MLAHVGQLRAVIHSKRREEEPCHVRSRVYIAMRAGATEEVTRSAFFQIAWVH
jgi:hypothetical protein